MSGLSSATSPYLDPRLQRGDLCERGEYRGDLLRLLGPAEDDDWDDEFLQRRASVEEADPAVGPERVHAPGYPALEVASFDGYRHGGLLLRGAWHSVDHGNRNVGDRPRPPSSVSLSAVIARMDSPTMVSSSV